MSDAEQTLDSRGAYAAPRYINDMKPTTRFHPSELPADLTAVRNFPRHLIDATHYTESPSGDADPAHRLEAAARAWGAEAATLTEEAKAEAVKLLGLTPAEAPSEPVAEIEAAPSEDETKDEGTGPNAPDATDAPAE